MYSPIAAVLCLFLGFVAALPSPDVASVAPSFSITTNTIQTDNGTMVETCVVSLTPVGHQIREVQNCTVSQLSPTLVAGSSTASPTAAAAFVMPGTSIQVLPIGLGVYGGITVIAVFFVAFVTRERIKYRKAFRERRVAEANSIGYGGVAKGLQPSRDLH